MEHLHISQKIISQPAAGTGSFNTGKSNIKPSLVKAASRNHETSVNTGPEGEELLVDSQFS